MTAAVATGVFIPGWYITVAYNILADRFEGVRLQVSVPADAMVSGADPLEGAPIPVRSADALRIAWVGLAAGLLASLLLLPWLLLFAAVGGEATAQFLPQTLAIVVALPVLGFVLWALDVLIYNGAARLVGGVKVSVS